METDRVLVAIRKKDIVYRIPGTKFNRCCSRCSAVVGIAPSGRRLLQAFPETVVLCGICARADRNLMEEGSLQVAPGAVDELRDYFRRD